MCRLALEKKTMRINFARFRKKETALLMGYVRGGHVENGSSDFSPAEIDMQL
jgi:hypothetical protein